MSDVMEMLQYDESEGEGVNVAIASASSTAVQLEQGRYSLYATVDCWFKRGGSDVVAAAETTAGTGKTSQFLAAGTYWFITVAREQTSGDVVRSKDKDYLAVIRNSADGVLYIRRAAR